MNRRWWAFGGAAVTVAGGLSVRAWSGGDFAKYAGDALYTVLVYAVVVLVAPRLRPGIAAAVALGFSWAVELLQIAGIPAVLRPLLGSTFNAPDLFWYAVGAGLCLLIEVLVAVRGPRQHAARPPVAPGAGQQAATRRR
ncbi:DUF2809 domain-containing protein [Streptomyces sp. SID14478]|uniref:ribosomal maturation YjgA family protein n=1 Tax=Streptomyces sp. SID14478 TaxID=2706073 RepID=UPI0013D97BEF|nr:DUF2809 domain-containing protein [Streptomyces sp. SID14478]NEB76612.1 DUF2809 domain-containing protein [Streptomyces sp. SID14478]